MKRWWIVPAFLGMALVASQPVLAQSNDDEEQANAPYNYAFGVGLGLVEAGQTENYFTAALRIRVGRDEDDKAARSRGGGCVRKFVCGEG